MPSRTALLKITYLKIFSSSRNLRERTDGFMVSFLVYVLKVVSLTNEVSLNEIFSRYSVLSNNPIFFW